MSHISKRSSFWIEYLAAYVRLIFFPIVYWTELEAVSMDFPDWGDEENED